MDEFGCRFRAKFIQFKQMVVGLRLYRLLLGLLLCLTSVVGQTTLSVAVDNKAINALATYTYSIVFNTNVSRNNLTLLFPPQVSLAAVTILTLNSTITLNSATNVSAFRVSTGNNSIWLNRTVGYSLVVAVSNVKNPPAVLQTVGFSIRSNDPTDSVSISFAFFVEYVAGTLASCNYLFSGTTEQTNCTLNVSATLANPLFAGSNSILIGYANPWENSKSKYLTYNATITCSFVAGNQSGVGSCTVFTTQVQIDFTAVFTLPTGTVLIALVGGVNCPPTFSTVTSASYTVITRDSQNREVDSRSSCTIANTTVTTESGVFNNLAVPVNAVYSSISVTFNALAITFEMSDTFDLVYEVSMPCGSATVNRGSNFLAWPYVTSPGTGICTYSANFNVNNNYAFNIKIFLAASMIAPPSAEPTTIYFLFKRNSSPYMNLTSVFTALAQPLLNSSFSLLLDSYSAVVSASYTFTLTLSQPIGAWGQVVLYLPLSISTSAFTNSSCSASIGSSSLSLFSCNTSQGSSNRLIVFSFAQSNSIAKGSILSLNVRGLGNSRVVFTTYSFGVETYYNRSLSLSRVEYNLQAAETYYTTYRSLSLSISPGTFFVYDNVNATMYYKNEVILPSGVVFTFTFPSAILDLVFNPVLVYANTTLLAVNESGVTTSGARQMTFRVNQEIPIGTNISVLFTLKTPANLGTYSFINLTIIKDGNTYEECVGTLQLAVTKASAVDFTITPTGSTIAMSTGAITSYRFTMTTYIPHPSTFFLVFSLPNDTAYVYNNSGVAGICSGNCNSAIRTPNSTLLNITMLNPNSSLKSFTFTLGFFVNPRSLGRGMLWNFSTFNVTGPQIGSGSAAVQITLASVLNASLAPSRRYYRNNTDPIELYVSLANKLIAGDFMLLQFGSDSYTAFAASLTCTKATSCAATNQTTANILVVQYHPSANELGLTQLTILIDGLISSPVTSYNEYKYFNISTYTSSKLLIDQGYATYNISCGQVATSRCKQCMGNGSCLSCYSDYNTRLFSGRCVNNCSTESYFQNYNSNGTCQLCGGGCATCISSISCITCVTAVNLVYYLYPQNQTCLPTCDHGAGYFSEKVNTITYCKKCYNMNCLVCKDDGMSSCTKCADGVVLESGQCLIGCTLPNTFLSAGVCTSCPSACRGCTANSVADCIDCEYPYLNDSKICVLNCHKGSVANYSTQTCGCGVKCRTCQGDSNYCLTCVNSSQVAFQGLCQGSTCPGYSYNSNGTCIRCTAGCYTCPGGICTACDNSTYSFQTKCFTDCNTVGQQYDNDVNTMKCVLCPNGCDRCDGLTCLSCLSSFSLQSTSCISDCMLLGNCKPEVPDKILPMPGTIAVAVWVILVIIVKLLLKKLYAPYSLMLGVCLVEFGLIIASLAVVGQSQGVSRLLLGVDYSYRLPIRNLLVVGLFFNYICNILYLIVFYKYIRPMITTPRQIDYIAHIAVLIVGTLTNYRFALIAFSRMFPKPHIPVDMASRITPINYLAVSSVLLDLITLAASGLLIYKEYPGTNLFMLGVDLLVVLVFVAAITVWMVAVPKPEDYYLPEVQKFNMEDNYRTEEDINQEKNQSYAKLVSSSYKHDPVLPDILNNDNAVDHKSMVFMGSSEEDNPPLPAIAKSVHPKVDQVRLSQTSAIEEADIDIDEVIHFENERGEEKKDDNTGMNSSGEEKTHSKAVMDDAKTKRISSTIANPGKKGNPSKGEEQLLQRKNREQAKNFSKERVRKLQPLSEGNGDLILVRSTKPQEPSARRSNDTPINLVRSKIKPKRTDQHMSVNKLPGKQSKVFQTEKSEESHTDEVDLQAIIDNKIKQSQSLDRGLKVERRKDPTEDISPSWFNQQNQRVDIAQIEQIE